MDIGLKYLPREVNNWEVTRALAGIIHSEGFAPVDVDGRVINFQVKLNDNPAGGVRNDGTGTLTLPSENIGRRFLAHVMKEPVTINGKRIKFFKHDKPPHSWLVKTLSKTPYINPDLEEERQDRMRTLDTRFCVEEVQFGIFYRDRYPVTDKERPHPRAFSIEWPVNNDPYRGATAWLRFDYDHKLFRIEMGNRLTDDYGYNVVVYFSSIQKIGIGYDIKPYICFDTFTPVTLEWIPFNRLLTGNQKVDNREYKHRVTSINEAHAIVAPYCPQLRLELLKDDNGDVIEKFVKMCGVANLAQSMIILCNPGSPKIEADRRGFFNRENLRILDKTLSSFDWPIAFQIESLIRSGLLHTDDLKDLTASIKELLAKSKKTSLFVGELLRRYNEALQVRSPRESPKHCFNRVKSTQETLDFVHSDGSFRCHHVTFTPTRMILEGPYPSQSNRVIRRYQGFEDHFIRVDFRDEDRLQYRWEREVDGRAFLEKRVGSILKDGFVLAGRKFEFLAYSNSALREHAVWYLNPFHYNGEYINTALIRHNLGNFEGTDLLQCPSKYAARLAQAFTATDPSVEIRRSEWKEVPDLGNDPYLFTDGVGSISETLGNEIWAELCKAKRNPENLLQPSAYQIRFLGYKGVVVINPALDERDGIRMVLRPSMGKFKAKEADEEIAPLEIAQAFGKPNTCYLNRPLVMLLEDTGVRRDVFLTLQDNAVREAKTIDDSITRFVEVLSAHRLGSSYGLQDILSRLRDRYNMDLTSDGRTIGIDNPFLRQIRQVAVTDILRDIKHGARIPVPDSYHLVGAADEGPAYLGKPGYENVYCLAEGEIYACIQTGPGQQPIYLNGNVSISRSPVAHLGDVQRVRAIGRPPKDKICLFSKLKNVVVMPSVGSRSLASCLGGGDVDGDQFSIICYDPVLPVSIETAASYEPLKTKNLGRDSTVEDICDFIVEYIHSDLLVRTNNFSSGSMLFYSDSVLEGMRDQNCLRLAELCSQAVDYPKQGTPLNIDSDSLPRTLIRCKPDWHAAEVVSPRETDYYRSDRALGYLFRDPNLNVDVADTIASILAEGPSPPRQPLSDPISFSLLSSVQVYLGSSAFVETHSSDLLRIFHQYVDELRYICATHTLTNAGERLLEAEVVVGSILANCSQKRWRKDRKERMRVHSRTLVDDIRNKLVGNLSKHSVADVLQSLELAWGAWDLSLRSSKEFGAQSFGIVALKAVFDCLDYLESPIN
ncbi:RdRP-domain-containing protein [Pholiota conissans]|uniref:RNA-dependent RNA polymerase n=1 Tax=Pholiota conissans TaxID=109636 RepID=A0A9P6D2I3_9AGAR|nr:RdRP-domain-containing protein [Pholiota conissans]